MNSITRSAYDNRCNHVIFKLYCNVSFIEKSIKETDLNLNKNFYPNYWRSVDESIFEKMSEFYSNLEETSIQ